MMKRLFLILSCLLLAGSVSAQTGTTVTADRFRLRAGPCTLRSGTSGSGDPNSVISGSVCDLWVNVSGAVWVKTAGSTGNTGWSRAGLLDIANTWTAAQGFTDGISSSLIPTATDTYNLGSYAKLWSQGYLSKLNAIIFALNTQTIFGGYSTIGYGAGTFGADVAAGDSTINFGVSMASYVGDWLLVRSITTAGALTAEYFLLGSNVSGTTYTVTRDLSALNSPNPAWPKGTPYLILGHNGTGRLDFFAYDGKPKIVMTAQGATYGAGTEYVRIGDLEGMLSIPSGKVGLALGDSAAYLKYYDGVLDIKGRIIADSGTFTGNVSAAGLTSGASPNPRVVMNSSGLTGYSNATAVQFSLSSSTGKATAGGGNVVLDANGIGIALAAGPTWNATNGVTFLNPPSGHAAMWGKNAGGTGTWVQTESVVSNNAHIGLLSLIVDNEAVGAGAGQATIVMGSARPSSSLQPGIAMSAGAGSITLAAGSIALNGPVTGTSFSGVGTGLTGTASGLTVGTATNATTATTSTYSTYLWSTTYPGSYYISNAWDGTYWQLTSNHGSPVNVGHATTAGTATTAGSATTAVGPSGNWNPAASAAYTLGNSSLKWLYPFVNLHSASDHMGSVPVMTGSTGELSYFDSTPISGTCAVSTMTFVNGILTACTLAEPSPSAVSLPDQIAALKAEIAELRALVASLAVAK